VIFGPKPRDFNIKMNRKERRLALRTALANREEDLLVVEAFAEQLPQPKTKELAQALSRWGIEPGVKVLMILEELTETVSLSARNLPNVKLMRANSLNVYDILVADKIVTTPGAIEQIQEVYSD
jgi:large subunit ribosomal protein L4